MGYVARYYLLLRRTTTYRLVSFRVAGAYRHVMLSVGAAEVEASRVLIADYYSCVSTRYASTSAAPTLSMTFYYTPTFSSLPSSLRIRLAVCTFFTSSMLMMSCSLRSFMLAVRVWVCT